MERKVIQIAGRTLVVSLPTPFVKKYAVKKGQDVHVSEHEGGILISFSHQPDMKKSELVVQSLGKFDKNYISYFYQKGYDEVTVFFDDERMYDELKNKVSDLMGFEIVEKRKGSCVIRSVSSVSPEEFHAVFRRMFRLLIEMTEELLIALKTSDEHKLRAALDGERTNNKLTDFLKRVINKHAYFESSKATLYYSMCRDFEKIADCYRDIAKHALSKKVKINPSTEKLYTETARFIKIMYELYYKFDKDKAREFLELRQKLSELYPVTLQKSSKLDVYIVSQLGSVITHVGELYGPYFTIMHA